MSRIIDFADGFTSASPSPSETLDSRYVLKAGDTISGNLIVTGNLTVSGTTTTINSTNLAVTDQNITLNQGGNDASAEGAGLTVKRTVTDSGILYDSTLQSKWKLGNIGALYEVIVAALDQTIAGIKTFLSSPIIPTPALNDNSTKAASTAYVVSEILNRIALTTKGDLLSYNGTAPLRVAVGTDGQALLADSTQTSGLRWGSAGGGTGFNYISNDDAEVNTTGYVVFKESDAVTFTDAGDLVGLTAHGLQNGNAISFTSITSTTGISTNTLYYVISANANDFQVSATKGGTALALTTNGSGTMVRARPKTGAAGGSPTTTWTRSTSSPLRDTASFLWTKDAANRMGEGVSYDFTIDNADKARMMQTMMDTIVGSGTFNAGSSTTDSDIIVYLYDVTNGRLLEPSTFKFYGNSSSVSYPFIGNFQTFADSTSYRLILYCATPNTSAFTVKFDNIMVSPTTYAYGALPTDWQSYTPTFTGFGTVTNINYWWRRVGSNMEITGYHVNGTVAASAATFTLPNNAQVSTSILKNNTVGTQGSIVGEYSFDSQLNATGRLVTSPATNANLIYFSGIFNGSSNNLTAANGSSVSGNNNNCSVYASVPIQGWASQSQMSDVSDQRIVSMRATGDPASASSGAPIIFPTVSWDTHTGYDATTGRYKVATAGKYRMHGCMRPGATGVGLFLYKNAVSDIPVGFTTSGGDGVFTGSVDCVAGDIIDIRPNGTYDAGSGSTLNIEKIGNPSLISATELIKARYTSTAGQSFTTGVATQGTFATKDYDSHNAWNGSQFTAPASGLYSFKIGASLANLSAGGVHYSADIRVNGTSKSISELASFCSVATEGVSGVHTDELQLIAGDIVTIYFTQSNGTTRSMNTTGSYNYITIKRIGL